MNNELSEIIIGTHPEKGLIYSVSTHFRLELIEPSAREVFILGTLVDREERWRGRVRKGKRTLLKSSETRNSFSIA